MTKTRKLFFGIVLSALFLLFSGLALSFGLGDVNVANAEEGWAYVSDEELAQTYYYRTELSVPQKKIVVDGEEIPAECTLVFPSGKAYAKSSVTLSESGTYYARYRAVKGDKVYFDEEEFFVYADTFEFVTPSLGSTMEYGVYDKLGQTNGIKGLQVKMHKNDVLRFNNVLKVSDLNAMTYIANFFPAPEVTGVYECTGVLFRLVDTFDPENWVEFDIHGNVTFPSGLHTAWMTVAANGQRSLGYEEGKGYHYKDNWGTGIDNVSFRAQQNVDKDGRQQWSGSPAPFAPGKGTAKFSFDPETARCYAGSKYSNDLDDPSVYGDDVWGGFTSDYVRLEVRLAGVVGEFANFVLVNVLGTNLDNTDRGNLILETDIPPVIFLEKDTEDMPKAQVGRFYELPVATAIDHVFGTCNVETRVIFNFSSETDYVDVSTTNNGKFGFTPENYGSYAVMITATNAYGNKSVKTFYVFAEETLDDIVVSLPDSVSALEQTTVDLGKAISFAEVTASGGAGGYYDYAIYYKRNGGDRVAIEGNEFTPLIAGEYEFIFTATDFIGLTGESSVTVNARASEELIVNSKVTIEKIYIADIEYKLPVLKGVIYKDDGSLAETYAKVDVTYKGETTTYTSGDTFVTPKTEENGDTFDSIRYYFGDETLQEFKDVPIIIGKYYRKGNLVPGVAMMENYFYSEGVKTSFFSDEATGKYYPTGIEISVSESSEKAGWTFANSQVADGLTIGIKGIAGDTHKISTMQFVLTDAMDSSKVVTADLKFSQKKVELSNGNNATQYDYSAKSFFDGYTYELKYTNGKIYFGTASVEIEKFDDGTEFNGFPSSLVYVSLYNVKNDQGNVKKLTRYLVTSVWGCAISVDRTERQAPTFSLNGSLTGSRTVGSTLLVPTAVCRDVFNPNSTITVSVVDANNNFVTSVDGIVMNGVSSEREYEVNLPVVGSYNVYYTTREVGWSQNSKDNISLIRVVDRIKPTARFATDPVTTAKRGDAIKFADIVVSDNVTETSKIKIVRSVISHGGRTVVLFNNDSFIPDYAGKYVFTALVMDEAGNFVTVRYTVNVTE